MNILFITQFFPFEKGSQYTTGALREFVEEWGKVDNRIKVIRPHFRHIEKEPFPENAKFSIGKNIDVEFVKPFRVPLLKWNFYSNKKIVNQLDFKPDVVVCHLYNAYFAFHRIAELLNVPLVIGIHMSDLKISRNRFHRWHQKIIFRKSDAFACRSHAYRDRFIETFPEFGNKTFLALSGIPEIFLNQQNHKASNDYIRLITVSSLIKRKQIDMVLRSLAENPPDVKWEYAIIGGGEEEHELKKLSKELEIDGNVKFLGRKKREDVVEELVKSDIFILPSYEETFGLVYLEAMACGCLTIGSVNEGIDGTIRDGINGFLCDAESLESIKKKLTEVIKLSPGQRNKIVQEAIETATQFTTEKMAEEYLNNLHKVIS
jgi:glycosyltransferase involved in cell wall biosynthesis